MNNLRLRLGPRPSDLLLTSMAALSIVVTSTVLSVSNGAWWAELVTALAWLGVILLFSGLAVARRQSSAESGAWLIVLGAVIAIGVICVNEFTYPFLREGMQQVERHTRYHFFVAGSYSLVAIVMIMFLALGPLRERRAWAWWLVAASAAIVLAGDIAADVSLYFHDLHFLIVGAWIIGLAVARHVAFQESADQPPVSV